MDQRYILTVLLFLKKASASSTNNTTLKSMRKTLFTEDVMVSNLLVSKHFQVFFLIVHKNSIIIMLAHCTLTT